MKVLVFVPCYNCEAQIHAALSDLSTHLKNFLIQFQILVVDNKSSDQTAAVAKSAVQADPWLTSHTKIIKNSENYGLGGSHKIAFRFAKENQIDFVLVFHGDHQAKALDISGLLSQLTESSPTIIGSRFSANSKLIGYSQFRIAGNRVVNLLYSLLLNFKVEDVGSGLNIYSLKNLNLNEIESLPNDFVFNMGLTCLLSIKNLHPKYVPITWTHEDQISNAKIFKVGWASIVILFRSKFKNLKTSTELFSRTFETDFDGWQSELESKK